ncbi:epoxyqueuosine reductase QueH [Sulfurimonas lithotrophica]|uniref:Epoxyqueuosine reductase QueH n=1 Tax=Sulfurimonas lithotrophica TaxID=2590022 RepID=A0A5P8NZM3_9BACT|nr:epoxyqueuosine reductase QueH [Sulfurimonas lithotrophica]QFR48915.1 epoxyqueuosine reductase QueH [Sulfurimonas lithotrophica]
MLVHICCSVDSHFFLEKLQKDYPQEKLTGFFYDPNIHPYSEYQLRLLDVQRSCKKLGIEVIEGEYDYESWMDAVKGLEKEPEKGARCEVCFDKRFETSANKALELGETTFTTTLLVSPLKSQEQLKRSGELFEKKHGVKFIAVDYRSGGGTQDQSRVTKEEQLYRQDYCGCIYGLTIQREQQNRLMDEMFSPVSGAILPASIEERLEFYKKRIELEDKGVKYKILKQKFLNYRQFSSRLIKGKREIIPSYTLSYSLLNRKKAQGRIEFEHDKVYYLNKDEIKIITLDYYNAIASTEYKNVFELIYGQENFENELKIRNLILKNENNYLLDLSPVIIVDTIPDAKITYELDAKIYDDVKEKLITL